MNGKKRIKKSRPSPKFVDQSVATFVLRKVYVQSSQSAVSDRPHLNQLPIIERRMLSLQSCLFNGGVCLSYTQTSVTVN